MSVAVIKTGGKQYKVRKGDFLNVEKLEAKEGEEVMFEEVLLIGDEKEVQVGKPTVKGAVVKARILSQFKGEKVVGVKHKAKKRYLKKFGHRQSLTQVEIVDISVK